MFNFESEFASQKPGLVATQAVKQTVDQVRRDVFESHRHRTFALAFYMTGNEVEAERILADTFIRAFQRADAPDGFEVDSALVAELSARFSLVRQEPGPVTDPGQSCLGERNVRRTELEAAVQDLPPNERLIFLLRDVEGYPSEKIANLLDLPVAQVQRLLLAARIRLRQELAMRAKPASEAA